jgi:hypothetical protein
VAESVVKPAVKEAKPEAPPKIPMGIDPAVQFQTADFSAVRGNASGAASKAAPAHGGGAAPALPGSTPLLGHVDVSASGHASRGKSPQRGPGRKSPSNPTEMT